MNDDDEAPPRRRPGRPRKNPPADAPELSVIPHASLVAMLAADRAHNAVGDVGGFVARADRETSLVGHAEYRREYCPVHGWIGRVAFEREGHAHCVAEVDQVAEEVEQVAPAEAPSVELAAAAVGRNRPRRTRPRSSTIARKNITREVLRAGYDEIYAMGRFEPPARPVTRADCRDVERPCPWVGCKHHFYLDVNAETGSIKINFPDLEPWELLHTCALDVAERGGITLEEVGTIMNLTRERIRQVEVRGLLKLKMISPSREEIGALHRPEAA